MRGVVLLVCALALTLGEEKTSIETNDETTKEDLNPEASSRRKYAIIITFHKHIICDLHSATNTSRHNFRAQWLLCVPLGSTFKIIQPDYRASFSVLYVCPNKQRLFSYTALTEKEMFTARYELNI
jgi:hypothetical protein